MNNLSTNALKQLSINDKFFLKKTFFKKQCPIRTNFESAISKTIASLYIVGKKISKWLYTPLNVGFL